jgi:hypothetical protein
MEGSPLPLGASPPTAPKQHPASFWQGILEIRSETLLVVLLVSRWLHELGRFELSVQTVLFD